MTVLLPPFQFLSLFSSSYLIAAAMTSITMLKRSDQSGRPCLLSDLKGKAFSFCLLNTMLAVGFHIWPLLF